MSIFWVVKHKTWKYHKKYGEIIKVNRPSKTGYTVLHNKLNKLNMVGRSWLFYKSFLLQIKENMYMYVAKSNYKSSNIQVSNMSIVNNEANSAISKMILLTNYWQHNYLQQVKKFPSCRTPYLFDEIEFIRGMVKQCVECISLCNSDENNSDWQGGTDRKMKYLSSGLLVFNEKWHSSQHEWLDICTGAYLNKQAWILTYHYMFFL